MESVGDGLAKLNRKLVKVATEAQLKKKLKDFRLIYSYLAYKRDTESMRGLEDG